MAPGLTGAYYANASALGAPAYTRTDPDVDFGWVATSPGGSIAAGSSYSVSWTGECSAMFAEHTRFEVESSDGVTLAVKRAFPRQSIRHPGGYQADGDDRDDRQHQSPHRAHLQERVEHVEQIHLVKAAPARPYQDLRYTGSTRLPSAVRRTDSPEPATATSTSPGPRRRKSILASTTTGTARRRSPAGQAQTLGRMDRPGADPLHGEFP